MRPGHPDSLLTHLERPVETLLDVGCNVGELLSDARRCGVPRLYGIEINPAAVAKARASFADHAHCEIAHGSADTLPFAPGSMDAVTCSEVLEHVPAELRANTLKEIARVLRAEGTLLLTVPHRGVFAFLDPANVRFLIPNFYARVSRWMGGRGRERGFTGQKHGVVWHHHFTLAEIRQLLGSEFKVEQVRYRGCVAVPVVEWILFPFYRLCLWNHWFFRGAKRLQRVEMRYSFGPLLGYNLLLVARKNSRTCKETIPQ